jgi:Tn3 transposase DDE domain
MSQTVTESTATCYRPAAAGNRAIATNRRDEQELSVLCLRVLQAAVVYVSTLMVQDVLAGEDWAAALTDADRRGLTPLFWTHVAPYGKVKLDMNSRLTLGVPAPQTVVVPAPASTAPHAPNAA